MSGRVTQRAILAIALPAMLTNVATALFGIADTWVIGRLGDPAAQGAVELGSRLLFSVLIVFNFLRTSTVGLTAQASGRGADEAQAEVLARALAVAVAIGALLLVLMPVVIHVGLDLLGAHGRMRTLARRYVEIRYWSGLPWLVNAVLTGWLVGRRRVRALLAVEVTANIGHILLDLALVLGAGLGVTGVAVATLASEAGKSIALATLASREPPASRIVPALRARATWAAGEIGALLRLNRDLFARTVLLMATIGLLTRAGAAQGPVVLAANAVIYQLFMLATLMLDGFESAAQVLCGEAMGASDAAGFRRLVRVLLAQSTAAALALSLVYAAGGGPLAASFSTAPAVVAMVRAHLGWVVLLPVAGVVSYVLDGVFIGCSWTRAMLGTMAAAAAGYAAALWLGRGFGNHGLWAAFSLFLALRGAGQLLVLPRLAARGFAQEGVASRLPM